ncbi:MAG: sigma 54-interacting transcriptional regulator [Myxococcota bacterium]
METIERPQSDAPRSYRFALLYEGAPQPMIIPVRPGQPVVVGRTSPADVVINDASLSRRHAKFDWREDGLVVEDLGSTNGSKTNGRPIMRTVVMPGDTITLGAVPLRVQALPSASVDGSELSFEALKNLLRARIEAPSADRVALALIQPAPNKPRNTWLPRLQAALHSHETLGPHPRGLMVIADNHDDLKARLVPFAFHVGARVALTADNASADVLIARAERLLELTTNDEPVLTLNRYPHLAEESRIKPSAAMSAIYARLEELANAESVVVVVGEPGVGKSLVAQRLHDRSAQVLAPLVRFNSLSTPQNLIPSILFGVQPDACAENNEPTVGLFERAKDGSLIIENLEHLPLSIIKTIKKTLKSGQLHRRGSTTPIDIQARIIVTTTDPAAPEYFEDVHTAVVTVPPLRQRTEEIRPLIDLFLQNATDTDDARHFTEEALQALESYGWPGNIRQLRCTVEQMIFKAPRGPIGLPDLPMALVKDEPK